MRKYLPDGAEKIARLSLKGIQPDIFKFQKEHF